MESNLPLERTIGVGILVRDRRGLPPLAAHPPWLAILGFHGGDLAYWEGYYSYG
jgi:hypothetical protein